jgi:hypothetical protein
LGAAISPWDDALRKLNLGLSAWVTISGGEDLPDWWKRELGYTKVGERWGIALRTVSGSYEYPSDDAEQAWLFNDAPRWMRIESIGKLPDLLEALLKQTADTTVKIQKKTAQARELGDALGEPEVLESPGLAQNLINQFLGAPPRVMPPPPTSSLTGTLLPPQVMPPPVGPPKPVLRYRPAPQDKK